MLSGVAIGKAGAQGFDFGFSKGALRPNEIFDSATSPPARYLVELARRIGDAAPAADFVVIANPLLPLRAERLAGWLPAGIKGAFLLSDAADFPLAYGLPRRFVADHERFLLTLSMVDAALDRRLLEALSGKPVEALRQDALTIGAYPVSTATGWFQGAERQKLLKITTANAIKIIEKRPDWRNVATTVYHPYHAGSIVFFAMAARDVAQPLFSRQVICSSYKDIVAASGSPLEPVWLKLPFLPRDNSVGEPRYFGHALDRLGEAVLEDNFLVFMRYSRNSATSPFHMIDHDRFALGERLDHAAALSTLKPPQVKAQCHLPAEPLRVLFHVTGGLPIKNYPLDQCKLLFRTLNALGVACSVIGRPDIEQWGAQSIEADETDLLAEACFLPSSVRRAQFLSPSLHQERDGLAFHRPVRHHRRRQFRRRLASPLPRARPVAGLSSLWRGNHLSGVRRSRMPPIMPNRKR